MKEFDSDELATRTQDTGQLSDAHVIGVRTAGAPQRHNRLRLHISADSLAFSPQPWPILQDVYPPQTLPATMLSLKARNIQITLMAKINKGARHDRTVHSQ